MARKQDHRRRGRDQSIFDRLRNAGSGAAHGALQGVTLGAGDEIFGERADMEGAQANAPIAFTLGSAIGALPWAALGARVSAGAAETPIARFLASTALGGAHGAAAGAFGMTPGDMDDGERLQEALLMAGLGAGVGGLSVPATRAMMDLDDNLPALMGRRRSEDGGVTQAGPGQGTRKSAPLNVRLAGEGSPEQRAEMALRLGLSMDEFEALQANMRGKLSRYGEDFTPFDEPAMGRTTRSAIDYAAQSKAGAARLNADADAFVGEQNTRMADSATLPGRGRRTKAGGLPEAQLAGFLEASTRPEYHAAWVRAAKQLPQRQRFELAEAMVTRMRADVGQAGDAQAARARLGEPQFLKKLEALGVEIDRSAFSRKANQRPDQLRDRAKKKGDYPSYADSERGFANVEDRLLAQRGDLSEADALALLDAAMRSRGDFFIPPQRPGDARMLSGEYEHGARFNPGGYFAGDDSRRNFNLGFMDIDASPTEMAILASQPMAALLHGLPTWDDPRGRK